MKRWIGLCVALGLAACSARDAGVTGRTAAFGATTVSVSYATYAPGSPVTVTYANMGSRPQRNQNLR
jgi:hypothetical protein